MPDLVGDLLCILEHAGVHKAIVVGYVTLPYLYFRHLIRHVAFTRHDWGSQLAYEAARERPDVFTGVIGITIPVIPSLPPTRARRLRMKIILVPSRSRATGADGGSSEGSPPSGVSALLRQADPCGYR